MKRCGRGSPAFSDSARSVLCWLLVLLSTQKKPKGQVFTTALTNHRPKTAGNGFKLINWCQCGFVIIVPCSGCTVPDCRWPGNTPPASQPERCVSAGSRWSAGFELYHKSPVELPLQETSGWLSPPCKMKDLLWSSLNERTTANMGISKLLKYRSYQFRTEFNVILQHFS